MYAHTSTPLLTPVEYVLGPQLLTVGTWSLLHTYMIICTYIHTQIQNKLRLYTMVCPQN